ncbi:MAG: 30S ribosomal protein S17 [Chloroflexi bacterium]|nr:30S ribosomal protein S17 [Chloroflexota bacterium]
MAGLRKTRSGRVVSAKMQKTVVVLVEHRRLHRLYGKAVRRTAHLKAHDEQGLCQEGDLVLLEETRPLSKEKRWRVVEVIQRGGVAPLPRDEETPA